MVNIGGNAGLIYHFHMGVMGAALASLVSRMIACFAVIYLLEKPSCMLRIDCLADLKPDLSLIRRILRVGIPAGIENGMFQIGKLSVSSLTSTLGTAAIAANAVAGNITTFLNIPANAVGMAVLTVIGQCLGAGEKKQASHYARRLMQQPASFYYGVLWNKLYRREIIAQNQLAFAPDVHWAEDLIFNMGYLEHAQVFVSISEAGYHYIQNPKSLCHTQIDLRGIVENKTQIFQLFKEVYTRLGLYEELQPQIYKFLFAFSESGVPSDSLQGALLDAMSRLNDASVQPEPSRKKPRRKPQKHARRKKPRHKEE